MIEEKTEVPNLDDIRRDLIALRVKHGADTAIGHRCSNLIEQLDNLQRKTHPEVRRRLGAAIVKSVAELATLTRDPQ